MSRASHCEHTSRPTQSRTGVAAPYFPAIAPHAGSRERAGASLLDKRLY